MTPWLVLAGYLYVGAVTMTVMAAVARLRHRSEDGFTGILVGVMWPLLVPLSVIAGIIWLFERASGQEDT